MRHLACIADGNRRWAQRAGLPKEAGHAQGLVAIERLCDWCIDRDVPFLTVYAFSTENWQRDEREVAHLFDLARAYFPERRAWYTGRGIRVRFSGRRDRLPEDIVAKMRELENGTQPGKALTLTICVDYGGRDEIARAVQNGARTEAEIAKALCGDIPEPELIVRTGGRRRLSNFLLWQGAYAELYFTDTLWPDMDAEEADRAARFFEEQTRCFGV